MLKLTPENKQYQKDLKEEVQKLGMKHRVKQPENKLSRKRKVPSTNSSMEKIDVKNDLKLPKNLAEKLVQDFSLISEKYVTKKKKITFLFF